jgi:uncharacterized protein YciI
MNRATILVLIAFAPLIVIATTRAQTKPSDQPKLHTFAIIYAPGPNWIQGRSIFDQDLMQHAQYMQKLLDQGKLELGGPFSDSTGGMAIIDATDPTAARNIMENDPAILNGIFTAKVHPWFIVFRARRESRGDSDPSR